MEASDFIDWQPVPVDPFGRTARGEAFRILPRGEKPEVHILLPIVNSRYFSGGPNTAFLLAGELAKAGYNIHCASLQGRPCSPETLRQHLVSRLGLDPESAKRFRVSDFHSGLYLREGDKLIATASWTLPTALDLYKCGAVDYPAYLIQDLEPLFLGFGNGHAFHMANYAEKFLPLINSSSLARALFNIGADSFADSAFIESSLIFEPAVDRSYFYAQKRRNKKKIFGLYSRFHSQHSRNLVETALEAIAIVAGGGYLSEDEWEIHCFGAPDHAPIRFANGIATKMLPWLDFEAYAAQIRSCDAGMALMCSPHPGYMTLELAASGAETVTNTYLSKNMGYLSNLSANIHPAAPTAPALADALIAALDRVNGKTEKQGQIALPDSWSRAFSPILAGVFAWLNS